MTAHLRDHAAILLAALTLAGCTATTAGHPEGDYSAQRAAELAGMLLTADEVNDDMNATAMTVDSTMSTMIDDPNMDPASCLAVGSVAQEQEYAGSNWSAVRVQSLHEPGEDFAHLLHQAVVEFPTSQDAEAFHTKSIDSWAACQGTYTYTPTGVVWNVGQSGQASGMLVASTSQRGAAWLCQRALTSASTIVADVLTCSSDPTAALTAQTLAAQIAANATNR